MFSIRNTTIHDAQTILYFIHELAKYEKLEDEVVATEQDLIETLFSTNPKAEVVLAFEDSIPIGFALYFSNYSTFLGKDGIHLEDLYIAEEFRGKGYGKALLTYVAQVASNRGAGRLEWNVLKWNTPAIDFYKSVGATGMEEWITYRLTRTKIGHLIDT